MATGRRYPESVAYPPGLLEPWRPSLDDWHRAIELGALDGQRIELLDGQVVTMSPKGVEHERLVRWLSEVVFAAVASSDLQLGIASALTLGEGWEPEPDLVLIPRDAPALYHPSTARWVCEVANTSLRVDRLVKRGAYARADIAEYWIVSLRDRCVEVYRDPRGGDYTTTEVVTDGILRSTAVAHLEVDLAALWAATFRR